MNDLHRESDEQIAAMIRGMISDAAGAALRTSGSEDAARPACALA